MNIGEAVYTETEYLQSLVPFDRISDVAASLGRIEDAVNKRIAELEQSYAAGLEAKCPHTLRKAVIDSLNERIGDLSDRLVEDNKRIVQLEGALEDIATYATIETPEVVREIISGMLKALRLSI
jgi:dGTP triphosphohydrolase